MSKEFHSCKKCGNTTNNDRIYKCKSCGDISCDACSGSDACENCGNENDIIVLYNWYKEIGYISN